MYSYASSSSLSSAFLLTFFVFLDFLGVSSSTSSSFPSSAFLFHFFFCTSVPSKHRHRSSLCLLLCEEAQTLCRMVPLFMFFPLASLFHFFPTSGNILAFSPVSFSISAISSLISSLDIFPNMPYILITSRFRTA